LVEIEAIAHVVSSGIVIIDGRQTESLFAKTNDAVMRMKVVEIPRLAYGLITKHPTRLP
jgi:restriction endonuclease Mrr